MLSPSTSMDSNNSTLTITNHLRASSTPNMDTENKGNILFVFNSLLLSQIMIAYKRFVENFKYVTINVNSLFFKFLLNYI